MIGAFASLTVGLAFLLGWRVFRRASKVRRTRLRIAVLPESGSRFARRAVRDRFGGQP